MDLETYLTKEAEAANTFGMETTVNDVPPTKGKPKAMVVKTAGEGCPDDNLNKPVLGKQPEKAVQSGPLKPHISVEGKEPPKLLTKKEAQYYALPSQERYPLDGYDQVIKAASYFEEWKGHMAPVHRREYCENLVKRAHALGVSVSETAEKYGSATYAPHAELQIALQGRRGIVKEAEQKILDELLVVQPTLQPELFAATLEEFDKVAGIDHLYDVDILDPYLSTYGVKEGAHDSTAALDKSPKDQDESFTVGNEYVTGKTLKVLAATQSKNLTDTFGEDFMKEFRKDTISIFKSLPLDQKKILIRMATDNSPK